MTLRNCGNGSVSERAHQDIVTLLEMEMGVRVYVRRLDGRIPACSHSMRLLAPAYLLNANHRRERRAQTAAHETGHFVTARRRRGNPVSK